MQMENRSAQDVIEIVRLNFVAMCEKFIKKALEKARSDIIKNQVF